MRSAIGGVAANEGRAGKVDDRAGYVEEAGYAWDGARGAEEERSAEGKG